MKVLVFATDILPLPGLPTSGTALRTFGMVNGLRAHGYDVEVSVPKTALNGYLNSPNCDLDSLPQTSRDELLRMKEYAFDPYNQSQILHTINPDAILCGHWPAMGLRVKPSQLLIVDLAGPHMLERHFQGMGEHPAASSAKLAVIATADYFIVSGPAQRLYFMSYLVRANVDQPTKRVITITMPLVPQSPRDVTNSTGPNAADIDRNNNLSYPNFIFGGVFLPWQNPTWGLENLVDELDKQGCGSLSLVGGPHPNYKIEQGNYEELYQKLSHNPRVTVKPLMPLEDFTKEMLKSDVAINLMQWNLERELAVTIRSTTYLWAGLPLIYDDFGDVGLLIKKYDAGWCITPGDRSQLNQVIKEIIASPELVKRKSQNALELSRQEFAWDRAVQPLVNILSNSSQKRLRETDIIVDTPENADILLDPDHSVEQYFIARAQGLSRVEFRVATHAKKIRQTVRYKLYELDLDKPAQNPLNNLTQVTSPNVCTKTSRGVRINEPQIHPRNLVAESTAEVNMLSNNDWLALDFTPRVDSAGKTFLLKLETENQDGERVSAWGARSNPYPMVQLRHGGKLLEHTCLCLKTTCSRVDMI